jgi:Asp/Glu/hydantoin racemase
MNSACKIACTKGVYRGNMIYQARTGQVAYGYAIGMLCAEWHIPFIPGDLNNAGTFPFPVRYESVKGVSGADVLRGNGESYAQIMVDAAKKLEAEGVRAITGNCGFMARFQAVVASQVNIPVFLTSLVQIPMLLNMLGNQHHIGILTANSASMTSELLAHAGITDSSRLTIQGMETYSHFNDVILKELGTLDEDKMRDEAVKAARDSIKRDPAIRAIMLECSDLPPYSKAIEEATGLPVFDWANFITYVYNATVPRTYSGIV